MSDWKAKIVNVQDAGDGRGNVTVEFYCGEEVVKRKVYEFHANGMTLEQGAEVIQRDLRNLKEFAALAAQVQQMVGFEIKLPEDVQAEKEAAPANENQSEPLAQ